MHLIVGGTGKLGSAIAFRLLAQGERVRVFTRDPARAARLSSRGAEVVRGDLSDTASLRAALTNTSSVFAAAHAMLGRGANSSERVDRAGHRVLIDEARSAGIGYFVYTSIVDARADHPIDFWRSKAAIEAHLERSGLHYTILRPTAFIETHAHELLGKPFLERGTALLFGRGETARNFVSVDDVAQLAVRAPTDPTMRGATIDVAGPDNLTDRQVAALYAELSGRPLKIRTVPMAALRLLSRLLRPLHPGISRVLRVSLLLNSGALDGRYDPTALTRYGIRPTGLREWIQRELAQSA